MDKLFTGVITYKVRFREVTDHKFDASVFDESGFIIGVAYNQETKTKAIVTALKNAANGMEAI